MNFVKVIFTKNLGMHCFKRQRHKVVKNYVLWLYMKHLLFHFACQLSFPLELKDTVIVCGSSEKQRFFFFFLQKGQL